MPTKKLNTRALRQLAEELVRVLAAEGEILDSEQGDFATSLVRQWITYDGNATLFLGQRQIYVMLGNTPLGKPVPIPEPAAHGWINQLARDWSVSSDDLPEIFGQLNRGQSAETVNGDGVPLRLWVNPKERSRGVEELVKQPVPPERKRDYRKIAADVIEQQFGDSLDTEEKDALACSVAKQWQRYDGHACLFIDGGQQLFVKLTERDDGGCDVSAKRLAVNLEPLLVSLGFAPEVCSEVIARINLSQEVHFRDREDIPSVLWHDPRARRVHVRTLDPIAPQPARSSLPIFCPKCSAVLNGWRAGEHQQTCPQCGGSVTGV
jgi:hypothetical protein